MGRLIGIVVVVAIGVFALWLIVDRTLFRFGAIGGLIFAFLLVFLLFSLSARCPHGRERVCVLCRVVA